MSKMEMINRMILLGSIKENERKHWLQYSCEYVTIVYIKVVPIRLKVLGRI